MLRTGKAANFVLTNGFRQVERPGIGAIVGLQSPQHKRHVRAVAVLADVKQEIADIVQVRNSLDFLVGFVLDNLNCHQPGVAGWCGLGLFVCVSIGFGSHIQRIE